MPDDPAAEETAPQETTAQTESPPTTWWRGLGTALVQAAGGVSLVLGLLWLLLNLSTTETRASDVGVGAVMTLGGLVLLMPHRVPLTWPAAAFALVAGIAGTAAGLQRAVVQECCMWAYAEIRGFPFGWLSRGASANSPDEARRLGLAAPWEWDLVSAVTDLIVWAYAGLLVFVVIRGIVRRGR